MLHNVDSVVNHSVHLHADDKSQAVKTEITASQLHILNVLARIVGFCLHSTESNCSS